MFCIGNVNAENICTDYLEYWRAFPKNTIITKDINPNLIVPTIVFDKIKVLEKRIAELEKIIKEYVDKPHVYITEGTDLLKYYQDWSENVYKKCQTRYSVLPNSLPRKFGTVTNNRGIEIKWSGE